MRWGALLYSMFSAWPSVSVYTINLARNSGSKEPGTESPWNQGKPFLPKLISSGNTSSWGKLFRYNPSISSLPTDCLDCWFSHRHPPMSPAVFSDPAIPVLEWCQWASKGCRCRSVILLIFFYQTLGKLIKYFELCSSILKFEWNEYHLSGLLWSVRTMQSSEHKDTCSKPRVQQDVSVS